MRESTITVIIQCEIQHQYYVFNKNKSQLVDEAVEGE